MQFHPMNLISLAAVAGLLLGGPGAAFAAPPSPASPPAAAATDYKARNQDPRARALLNEAKAKLASIRSLIVDAGEGWTPDQLFERKYEIMMQRPNRYRISKVGGLLEEHMVFLAGSDGQTITDLREAAASVALTRPVRAENFFLGVNSLVQFFFDPKGISFDPSTGLWGRPVSEFENNVSAYDKDTKLSYLGAKTVSGIKYEVVEIKYNTARADIRQQLYIGDDKLIYQINTYSDTYSQQGDTVKSAQTLGVDQYRNYRINATLPESTWHPEVPKKMAVIATDPVRMGALAPDFTLPGYEGGEMTLKDLLKNKKGLYVSVLDGSRGKNAGPDFHLPQMRLVQEMKNKFEKQGLGIVVIVGGSTITPDLKKEMLLNWMPDLSRFNYPILLDFDIERGMQGSAYHNFQLDGRNSLLLDSKGRVVFASKEFTDAVNNLSFYQALAQIGFQVSPADLENAAK